MLLIAVFGMLTTVELLGFVALNMVKSNAPSAFVAFFVILIVGGSTANASYSGENPITKIVKHTMLIFLIPTAPKVE